MYKLLWSLVRDEEGAETVEYALVLGLVALAAAAAVTLAGGQISTWWVNLSTAIASVNSVT
jgi:Flp pilus assembly pilin Flp